MQNQHPVVSIGIMIFKDNQILLGKRLNEPGKGEWVFPGGKLENGEGFEACALREVIEETGMAVKNVRFRLLANIVDNPPHQCVYIGMVADWVSGDPQAKEPEKIGEWRWFPLAELPKPFTGPTALFVESYQHGVNFVDLTTVQKLPK